MEILYIVVAFVVGGLFAYLITKSLAQKRINQLELEKSLIEERLNSGKQEISSLTDNLKEQIIISQELNNKLAVSENDKKHLNEKLESQIKEIEEIQNKFKLEFENIATRILKTNTSEFTQLSQKNIGDILNPLKEKIQSFEKKVQDTYEKELRDTTSLREELKKLSELNKQISIDASNLTNALKLDTKKQGNWGEIILERVLERSGLIKGEEYFIQASVRGASGELLRPDVIINLPDQKHVVIDAKVSLTAYEAFINSDIPEEREKLLKQHSESIKNHINELSLKNYQNIPGMNSPDFVLLFIPIESSFSVALKADIEIFNYAWSKNIVIVSPTTLLATLRTISSLWKHEKQTKNAIEIAEQSGKLYDKFVLFLNDLEKMDGQISTLRNTFDEAKKKISSGKGNLISKVENLRKMGAKATKEVSAKYLQDDNLLTEPEE